MQTRILDALPAPVRRPIQAVITEVRTVLDARLPGLAAEIAFWVLLSLPALLVAGIAAAGIATDRILGPDWQEQVIARVTEVATVALTPGTIDQVVEPVLRRLLDGGGAGVVSFAFLAAVWTASRAVKTVLTTLAIVSERSDVRSGWQDRLLGFAITLGGLVVGTVLAPLLVAGPGTGQVLQDAAPLELSGLARIWSLAYWPTVIVFATLALAALYHFGVPGRTRWRWALPGAMLATGVWLAGSAGLRIYGSWVVEADGAYGPLAGPIVALLWLWVTGFAVLLGGLLNARLTHHSGVAATDSGDDTDGSTDDDPTSSTATGRRDDQSATGTSNEKTVPSSSRLTTPN